MKVLLDGVKEAQEEVHTDSAHQRQVLHALLTTESQILDQLATYISATTISVASLQAALQQKVCVLKGMYVVGVVEALLFLFIRQDKINLLPPVLYIREDKLTHLTLCSSSSWSWSGGTAAPHGGQLWWSGEAHHFLHHTAAGGGGGPAHHTPAPR